MEEMKSLMSLEAFKSLSEEEMLAEVKKVLPLLSPVTQAFTEAQETINEVVIMRFIPLISILSTRLWPEWSWLRRH